MPKTPDSTKDKVPGRMLKTPPKPHTQLKGRPQRAESHKGNKVQPARQRNSLQKGR
jgi:hypothetical protein